MPDSRAAAADRQLTNVAVSKLSPEEGGSWPEDYAKLVQQGEKLIQGTKLRAAADDRAAAAVVRDYGEAIRPPEIEQGVSLEVSSISKTAEEDEYRREDYAKLVQQGEQLIWQRTKLRTAADDRAAAAVLRVYGDIIRAPEIEHGVSIEVSSISKAAEEDEYRLQGDYTNLILQGDYTNLILQGEQLIQGTKPHSTADDRTVAGAGFSPFRDSIRAFGPIGQGVPLEVSSISEAVAEIQAEFKTIRDSLVGFDRDQGLVGDRSNSLLEMWFNRVENVSLRSMLLG